MNSVSKKTIQLNSQINSNSFTLLELSFPHAFMVINEQGLMIFANLKAQELCCQFKQTVSSHSHYEETINSFSPTLKHIIQETLDYKRNVSRQAAFNNKSFLIESQTIFKDASFLGCSIVISDITYSLFKEKRHELLYQISSALSGISNMDQLLKVAVSQIMRSMNISSVNIMLLDAVSQKLSIKIDSKPTIPNYKTREFKLGEGVAGKSAKEIKPYSIFDVTTSSIYSQRRSRDKGALLVVPMITRGQLFGVINVSTDNPRYFTENEVQFLTIVANDIAIALENSFLYERLNQKMKLLSKLFWISSFAGVRTLDNRLQRIVGLVADLLEAEDSCIYLFSQPRHSLVLRYQKDNNTNLPLQIDLNQEGLSRTVFESQETHIINQLKQSHDPVLLKNYPHIRNIICFPLHVNQKHIGILYVINKRTGNFNEDDKHLLTITAHRIVTIIENAQLLRKVQAEKDLLDSIIKNTNEGVVVLNNKKRIVIWNSYLEQLTGLDAHEVIGLPCYKIFFSRLHLRQLTAKLYTPKDQQEEDSGHIEEQMSAKSGGKIWIGCLYSQLTDQNNAIAYTIMVFRNISKDKELIEAKNEFVSLATHELRTPLTAIKGYLSMILQGDAGGINTAQRRYFQKTYNATERLVGLVEELLDVVRIDENRLIFTSSLIDLHTIVTECIEDFALKAKAKNITITNHMTPKSYVWADPDKTKQIISNLIDNALKYTRDKGKIDLTCQINDKDIITEVHDTGVGIPMNQADVIFDRFIRLPNPLSVKAGGTGLGLFIVKQLVERQGGKIWLESRLKRGSSFYFTLPRTTNIQEERKESHDIGNSREYEKTNSHH